MTVYAPRDSEALQIAGMTVDAAVPSPGGMLAIALVVLMSKRSWRTDEGFDEPFLSRLDSVATSDSIAGLQGRMILVRDLAFLENADPAWVSRHFLPRLHWPHTEATPLWRARGLPHWSAEPVHRSERRLLGGGAACRCDREHARPCVQPRPGLAMGD